MFDYVLNMPLSLVVNGVWVDEDSVFQIRMKDRQKIKVLLNGTAVVNVKQ